jgi:hypothetical protein
VIKNITAEVEKLKHKLSFKIKIYRIRKIHKTEILRLKKSREKVKVVFLVLHESIWKYEGLYLLMQKSEKFDPVVVVCPFLIYDKVDVLLEMNNVYESFKKNGYNTLHSLSQNSWLNLKKTINPDIIFFTNPHEVTINEYLITNFLDTLTCYVPYSFQVSNLIQLQYNQFFHNVLWQGYYETKFHKNLAFKYSRTKGKNISVVGYPNVDYCFENNDHRNLWRTSKVKIIYSPHHSIPSQNAGIEYSTFLSYCDFILEMAIKYKDSIEICFKPHPILKVALEKVWDKQSIEFYFKRWEELPNTFIWEGDYKSLFFYSDGIINDSGSFVAEYLFLNKPGMFLLSDQQVYNQFNEFGRKALECYTIGKSKEDIEGFFVGLINQIDVKKNKRERFIKKYREETNYRSASENIFNSLLRNLS